MLSSAPPLSDYGREVQQNSTDVAANEEWNQGCSSQDVSHWPGADVEAGQQRVVGRIIQHGHSSSLYDTAGGPIDRLKRAEIHQGHLFVRIAVAAAVPLSACRAQCTIPGHSPECQSLS
jgi:hypothetical protein